MAHVGAIGEDVFVNVALGLSFDREQWGVGFRLPLRFRVIDRDPQNDGDVAGVRGEDWDQISDYLRLLRYVYIGQADKKGPFYIRLGELSGLSLGHGTILHRYFNGFDLSRFQAGLNVAVNVGAFSAEAMVGDLMQPYLSGGRFTVRPLQLAGLDEFWHRFVVGASIVVDADAPFVLETDGLGRVVVNDQNEPEVLRARSFVVSGIDLGFELLRSAPLSITPYIDLNQMSVLASGRGLHLGVLWTSRLSLGVTQFAVDARTEYRRVSGDYRSPYFDTVYEIERYQVLSDGGGAQPKLALLCGGTGACAAGPGRNGVYMDVLAGFPGLIQVGGEYVDYDGPAPDGTLRLSLFVPALQALRLSAFYYRVNVDGAGDLLALDDKSAVVAAAEVPMGGFFFAQARWWRIWEADGAGGYQSVDDWSLGLGFRAAL